ncbi:TetR/AcrR family transcriptional regulator [Vibrio sp. SCSIO 43136]|uniref:TetR/AcrR family transcriptional regulator n=1 Tax=Vibrio sp. SCSIO 43136 TaxID=2819101 RepID=UPI002074D295|nr:TetR/AcrR family transcriptional regulator [Vibrio sp. SCSIO 43136]USD67577.1 TetR/AcrR family transcriptional regulator [Vibrio sp. SCSIO 43136]
MNMKTNQTRQHILEVGYQLIVNKGFTAVGLSELLKTAEVPKGSFYHYFKSKEQFGEALIVDYFDLYLERIEAILLGNQGTGLERVMDYFSRWLNVEEGVCNANKCAVVKLSAEVADLSEPMREALNRGAARIVLAIAKGIEAGIDDGSIQVQDATGTAKTLYQLWLGASLLNKLSQDGEHLHHALSTTKQLLKAK